MSEIDDAIAAAVRREVAKAVHEEVEKALAERAPAPALLDGEGLAQALGVSRKTVRRLEQQGLPFVRIIEAKRYELDRVREWLRGRAEPKLRVVGGRSG